MIAMMLAAAVAVAPPVPPVPPLIVEGSRGWHSDRRILQIALTAPEPPRRINRQRLCFDDTLTRPGITRRVCRSRQGWNRLGLDPVLPIPGDREIAAN